MLLPPTSRLPPISRICFYSHDHLWDALKFIRFVYCPEVRGSRCRRALDRLHNHDYKHHQSTVLPKNDSEGDNSSDADLLYLRSDPFERSYTIKWLTALVTQAEALAARQREATSLSASMQNEADIIQEAASILAICAGTASAGTITRTFAFPSRDGQRTIKAQLTDVPLDNHDYSSVGSQTWGGACVLAERIVRYPEYFSLVELDSEPENSNSRREERPDLRVLELGAGTGLVSLTLAKLLESYGHWTNKRAEIVATDFYPSVLENLQNNIVSNFATAESQQLQPSVSITSQFLDWKAFSSTAELPASPFDMPFDLILGADIVYEAEHALWIKECLSKLLRKPRGPGKGAGGIFHLVVPLRPTHTEESSSLDRVFHRTEDTQMSRQCRRGVELCIISTEIVVCDAHDDNSEDGAEYAYYRIGWY